MMKVNQAVHTASLALCALNGVDSRSFPSIDFLGYRKIAQLAMKSM